MDKIIFTTLDRRWLLAVGTLAILLAAGLELCRVLQPTIGRTGILISAVDTGAMNQLLPGDVRELKIWWSGRP